MIKRYPIFKTEEANKVLNEMKCECNWDGLCKKCAIEQACEDGYYTHEICFNCTQPLEYCTCERE